MPDKYDRREILKYLGTLILSFILVPLGLAGCSGDGEELPPPPESDSGTSTSGGGSTTKQSSGEPTINHQVPHPKDAELPEAEAKGTALGGAERAPGGKSPKDGPSVQYQHKPNGKKYCGNCTMFVPDENGDGFGACTLVEGKIHHCDFCILFSKHTGEGSIPCKQA